MSDTYSPGPTIIVLPEKMFALFTFLEDISTKMTSYH